MRNFAINSLLVLFTFFFTLVGAEITSYLFDFSAWHFRRQGQLTDELLSPEQRDFLARTLSKEKLFFDAALNAELEAKAAVQGLDLSQKHFAKTEKGYRSVVRTKLDGQTIYDAWIGTDPFSRRVVPGFKRNAERGTVFLGDSFVFGEGLNDSETMPARFQELNPDSPVYNLGIPGAGPNDIFNRLQEPDDPFFSGINSHGGTVYYVFQDFHEQRANCNLSNFYEEKEYRLDKPLYALSGENLVYLGKCRSVRSENRLFTILARSNFVRANHLDWPFPSSSYPKRLVTKLLSEVKRKALERFNADQFVVVLYPSQRASRNFLPYFLEAGIKVLDFSHLDIKKITRRSHQFPGDEHPSPAAALVVANLIHWNQKRAGEVVKPNLGGSRSSSAAAPVSGRASSRH